MGIQNITSPEGGGDIFLMECNRTTCQRRKKNSEAANVKIL
jgi:hypothetical protein